MVQTHPSAVKPETLETAIEAMTSRERLRDPVLSAVAEAIQPYALGNRPRKMQSEARLITG
jgi:hypothetical protein